MARPSKYDPEFHPKSYIELSRQGKWKAQICSAWEISRDTLHRWGKDESKPEVSEAIKKGDECREDWWQEEGKKLMRGEYSKGNAAIYCFLMKNGFGYKDKVETTHNVSEETKKLIINT